MTASSGAAAPNGEERQQSRSEQVYQLLRADIGSLRLEANLALREGDLSERYNTSRTPVREAMRRLEQEGFLEKRGRQLYVREFTIEQVQDLYEIREGLEKMAVRLTIERATDKELHELGRQLEQYETFDLSRDYGAFSDYANQFHRSIAWLSRNRPLAEKLEEIHDQAVVISSRWMIENESIREAFREHSQILRAILERDVVVAEALMRSHIRSVIILYRQSQSASGS